MQNIDPKIAEYIEQRAREIALEVYTQKGTQFGVANVPAHTHNNIDSNNIPPTSVSGFYPLPGTNTGIVSPQTIGNQVVTQGSSSRGFGHFATVSPASFVVYPQVIIFGNGGGTDSQFNGGDAPEGTMIFFINNTAIGGLWVRAAGQWWGIAQGTVGYENRTL